MILPTGNDRGLLVIIVRLLGGLGNQMFQYALGRRLSSDYKTFLTVDCSVLENRRAGQHSVQRHFALDIFTADIRRAPAMKKLRYSAWGLPRLLRPAVRSLGLARESRQIIEDSFGFDPRVLNCGREAYISGLWQSFQYFSPIDAILRADFRFRYPILPEADGIAKSIAETNSVCLHVRRTDYVTHQNSSSPLGFVGLDYYRTGVRRILDESPDANFFVFSDDLSWCKEELTFVPKATFVPSGYAGFKDSTHLQLMTRCRSFLIPNSTFSWWAAWLSDLPNKRVFVPQRWFRDEAIDTSGFYPDGWLRLAV